MKFARELLMYTPLANLIEIRLVFSETEHVNGQTDRHDLFVMNYFCALAAKNINIVYRSTVDQLRVVALMMAARIG